MKRSEIVKRQMFTKRRIGICGVYAIFIEAAMASFGRVPGGYFCGGMVDGSNGRSDPVWTGFPAGSTIVGVTKSTTCLFVREAGLFSKRRPNNGMSPRTGILLVILLKLSETKPPSISVCPSSTVAVLRACRAYAGEYPHDWHYAGRERIYFAAERDAHEGCLGAYVVPGLPPLVRTSVAGGDPSAGEASAEPRTLPLAKTATPHTARERVSRKARTEEVPQAHELAERD